MNTAQPEQQTRTALWDSDVDMVLSGVYQQSVNISPFVTSTQQYINSIKVFDTQEKAQLAKSLVEEFNREATEQMAINGHPSLSDSEVCFYSDCNCL
jgi:lipoate-protein ligase A